MDDRNPLSLLRTVREELQTIQQQVDYLVAVLESQARDGLYGTTAPGEVKKPSDLEVINRALLQMAGKQSQEEILEVLLSRAAECAERAILFDAGDSTRRKFYELEGVNAENAATWFIETEGDIIAVIYMRADNYSNCV